MTNQDSIKWLENLKQDIGQLRHEELWHYEQAIDEIVELLKEHEVKTIIKKWHINPLGDYSRLHCPWCDRELDRQSAKEYVACPYCGRKVTWDE